MFRSPDVPPLNTASTLPREVISEISAVLLEGPGMKLPSFNSKISNVESGYTGSSPASQHLGRGEDPQLKNTSLPPAKSEFETAEATGLTSNKQNTTKQATKKEF